MPLPAWCNKQQCPLAEPLGAVMLGPSEVMLVLTLIFTRFLMRT